jgi:transcriptional regulator with XRE-family HTH domain
MSTRVVAADQGRRAIAHAQRELLRDLRDRRLALGLSQRTVAGAAGIGRSMLGRIERGEIASPDITDLGAMAAVLGLALRIAMYPQGQPIADRVQLRLLAAFRDRIPQSMGWRTEVPLPVAGDRRAWDAVVTLLDGWTAIEGISRLGAVDATIRRAKLKLRDDPRIERLVLVILDTNRNRAALAAAGPTIRDDFPLDTRAVLSALHGGHTPSANGIVLLRVPPGPGRPQAVHTGGKTVDARGAPGRKFVDKPVGGAVPGP